MDKGWNADYFYCDHCYDDFLKEWPLAYSAMEAKFQVACIDLDTFYSGSRLCQYFSQEDFRRLIVQLECRNCGADLDGNIWPYELPFSVPIGFVKLVGEISKIASYAPFLLLAHPFSVRIFELVKRLVGSTIEAPIQDRLYRARRMDFEIEKKIEVFDFPPAQFVGDGRYNHAGRPVLYIASSLTTCVEEMRKVNCLVMAFKFDRPLKIFDLVDLDSYDDEDEELLGALSYSALVSAPSVEEGWGKPAYVFTRFLADCAAYAGFDAIKYPSTRIASQDGSYNLVLLDRELTLADHVDEVSYDVYIAERK